MVTTPAVKIPAMNVPVVTRSKSATSKLIAAFAKMTVKPKSKSSLKVSARHARVYKIVRDKA